MSRKIFAQVLALVLLLLVVFGAPLRVNAGGVCGGTYIADPGDTVDLIAAKCGTTASIIYAANPGISGNLSAGQVLTVPGINYYAYPVYPTVYPTYPVYNNYAPAGYSGTYQVQSGDTFSDIAIRYGVSVNDLMAANPYIYNINYLYAGQIIYMPNSAQMVYGYPSYYYPSVIVTPTPTSSQLSYGSVPAGTPYGKIQLSNKANGDVYVSLQGTTRDGVSVINEYPVDGTMNVKIPAGWYTYVAWVGGKKFEGQFNLGGDSDHSITFYSNKVVVD